MEMPIFPIGLFTFIFEGEKSILISVQIFRNADITDYSFFIQQMLFVHLEYGRFWAYTEIYQWVKQSRNIALEELTF